MSASEGLPFDDSRFFRCRVQKQIREGFYDSTCGICSAKKVMIRLVPRSPIEVSREMVLMLFVPVKSKVCEKVPIRFELKRNN